MPFAGRGMGQEWLIYVRLRRAWVGVGGGKPRRSRGLAPIVGGMVSNRRVRAPV